MTRSATGLLRKLRGRGPHELWVRGRQEVQKRCDLLAYRLSLRRSGRPRGAAGGRRGNFFFSPAEIPRVLDTLRTTFAGQSDRTLERAERICAHEFDLLGYSGLSFGEEIDWHRDVVHDRGGTLQPWYRVPFLDFEAVGDHKIIWELNRHQHLVVLAKAYLLTGERRYVDELIHQWRHWVRENPYPLGINWASALEVAFRSMSWIWVDQLLRDVDAVPAAFRGELQDELGRHGKHLLRYLSTYFAPNTHLLGEGAALFFIGTLYPELPGAPTWRRVGWRIVVEESEHQVRADGLHFEQSIYYHVYALDFFLHAWLLAQSNSVVVPQRYERTVERMLEALARLSPTGVAPRMGDDDGGRLFDPRRNTPAHMLDPLATGAALFGRDDWLKLAGGPVEESLWLLGPSRFAAAEKAGGSPPPASAAFENSGLYVMTNHADGDWRLVVDAGPQGYGRSGHGHADALSLQLASGSGDWLVDVGTYTYMRQPQRDAFRGTSAHNTLAAGGIDQAMPSGPFAWECIPETRVERWESRPELDYLCALHDGYERSPTFLTHRRTVVGCCGFWLVRDEIIGTAAAELLVSWHLSPRLRIEKEERRRMRVTDGAQSLELAFCGADWQRTIEDCDWSPAYGAAQTTPVVRLRSRAVPPAELATLIATGSAGVSLECTLTEETAGYRVTSAGSTYRLVFRRHDAAPHRPDLPDFALYRDADGDPEAVTLISEVPSFRAGRKSGPRDGERVP